MDRPTASPAWRRALAVPALLAALGLALLAPTAAFSAPLTSVFVNGSRVEAYPLIREGVAYLPINSMAEALEVAIVYDSRLNIIKVDGSVATASPYMADGKVYLPVEAFIQTLGGSVTYDGREKAIRVQTPAGGAIASTSPPPMTRTPTVPVAAPPVAVSPPPVAAPAATYTPAPVAVPSATYTPAPVAAPSSGYRPPTAYAPPPASSTGTGYRTDQTQPGYPAPYAPNPTTPTTTPRPISAPPNMPPNLSLPQTGSGVGREPVGYAPMPANATPVTDGGVYVPRSAQSSVFQVTVTNLETVEVIKDFYRPRTGYKFVVVYLSQQNISEEVQIYTGRFSMMDQKNASYDYIEGLSNFWLVILRPFGINFGYLVFEVPVDAKPMSLVLHALNQAPLTLNL